jgi:dipeptidyl aminopeptidase/acylaminoacyl peptidase
MRYQTVCRFCVSSLLTVFVSLIALQAQHTYQLPPQEIVDILDAPPLPVTRISPDGIHMIFMYRETMPTIEDLAIPYLNLAGFRVDPQRNIRYSPMARLYALRIKNIETGVQRTIQVPDNANIGTVEWSADGTMIYFTHSTDDGMELWISDIATGHSTRIPDVWINDVYGRPLQWMPGEKVILAQSIPGERGSAPGLSPVPTGPIVQESDGRPSPVRTYQNLLTGPDDERLFDHYATSQLIAINIEENIITELGEPAIFQNVSPSPDGRFILVSRVIKPYSYLVPAFRFPTEVEIWSRTGELTAHLASIPLAEDIPLFGVAQGPRSHSWVDTEDARVMYIEALDEGDPRVEADYRDRVMVLDYPFNSDPQEWARTGYRYAGIVWGEGVAILNEYDRPKSRLRSWLLQPSDLRATPVLLYDRDPQDRYNDPGTPVMRYDSRGNRRMIHSSDGNSIFLTGQGASSVGDRPFLDRLNLITKETRRLWQTGDDHYEYVVDLLDPNAARIITRRETSTEPPNYYIRHLADGSLTQLTEFEDPHPQLTGIHREMLIYERADGIQLSATLYLPPDYREGDRLPLVVWMYPLDYTSADAASQVRGNPNRFTFFRGSSHLFFLTQGYAILDGPSLPIIGEEGNDTYAEQLVMGIEAAISKLEEMNVVDTERMGIGGHSYGAFSTANALIHTDLFRAGIARSGAYNRTLTPFGFQSERRTFWEAQDTYMGVSPFTHAGKINQPILILHGMDDSNSGTYPIQSERLYHALRGLGGISRYVQYPYEDHGYRARETVLDVLYHMVDWFDRYVKDDRVTSN